MSFKKIFAAPVTASYDYLAEFLGNKSGQFISLRLLMRAAKVQTGLNTLLLTSQYPPNKHWQANTGCNILGSTIVKLRVKSIYSTHYIIR